MSNITVVSGWNEKGYDQYGKRFIAEFHEYWPKEIDIKIIGEQPELLPRGEFIALEDCDTIRNFLIRHKDNKQVSGAEIVIGWNERERREKYSYRYDAYKFCRMAMIPYTALQYIEENTEYLIWLDGDVFTDTRIPEGFLESLLMKDTYVAYLGRKTHSDTGFVLFKLPEAVPLIKLWHDTYANDLFFALQQWHSAYTFDACREIIGLMETNITPQGRKHVFVQSPLNKYLDHMKGAGKYRKESTERISERKRLVAVAKEERKRNKKREMLLLTTMEQGE